MAGRWASFVSCIIFIFCSAPTLVGQPFWHFIDEAGDTVYADSLDIDDDTRLDVDKQKIKKFVPADTSADSSSEYSGPILYEPAGGMSYYSSYLSGRSLGDLLNFRTGALSLQHGSIGQPEMATSSVMLPGMAVSCDGLPVFHQGTYFPFRGGPDLTVMMADNIYAVDIASLHNLNIFSQGQELALRSMVWPGENNPSSVTVAQGPYDYEKSAWRFSRRFKNTVAASFTAAFKESRGFYAIGADYDDFRVSGSMVWRPKSATEIQYGFYQYKAKQGLMQFDRMVEPTARSNNDLNHHRLRLLHRLSESLFLKFDMFRQHNYNRIYDDSYQYDVILKDDILGGSASLDIAAGRHNFALTAGGKNHKLTGIASEPSSATLGVMAADSIAFSDEHMIVLKTRVRYNNRTDTGLAGTVSYRIKNWSAAIGALDYEPDIYARYYDQPRLAFGNQSLIAAYQYIPDPDLMPKKTLFASSALDVFKQDRLQGKVEAAYEKVYNDLVPAVESSDSGWTSSQQNTDYGRITLTADIGYGLTRYFTGRTGITYFYYDQDDALPGVKHSPSLIVFSHGEIKVREVLKDIDLSGVFQVRYYSKRYYYGISSVLLDKSEYGQAVVVDGSLVMRFGSFEFRITEDNILDFIIDNNYGLWGEYTMPPGMVWWQFTWNFID